MVTTAPRPIAEERPAYLAHPAMTWARFVEGPAGATDTTTNDDTKPGTDPKDANTGDTTPATDEDTDTGTNDEALGEGGKRAIQAERAKNKDLSTRNKDLDAALAAANAKLQKIEDAKLSDIDRVTKERDEALARVAERDAQLAVRDLAATHKITDANDIEFLQSQPAEQREALAKRLAPKDDAGNNVRQFRPVPGSGTGGPKDSSSIQAGRDAYAARHAKN